MFRKPSHTIGLFKPQTTTTAATNCDQSRFSVGLGLLLLLRRVVCIPAESGVFDATVGAEKEGDILLAGINEWAMG